MGRDASTFTVVPAIDLRDGRAVRLRLGDFEQEDVYSDDPVAVATGFASAGARWLHIVDLDGARAGEPRHSSLITSIVTAVQPRTMCEVGGGLRSERAVESTLATGARRAVLGTIALNDPALVGRLVERHGANGISVAMDVRDGLALGDAWRAGARGVAVTEAVAQLAGEGVTTFEVTAIDRDGTLTGPDLELLGSVVAMDVAVIASAGVRSVADLRAIRAVGCTGAIVGRALYDGSFDLAEALSVEA